MHVWLDMHDVISMGDNIKALDACNVWHLEWMWSLHNKNWTHSEACCCLWKHQDGHIRAFDVQWTPKCVKQFILVHFFSAHQNVKLGLLFPPFFAGPSWGRVGWVSLHCHRQVDPQVCHRPDAVDSRQRDFRWTSATQYDTQDLKDTEVMCQ